MGRRLAPALLAIGLLAGCEQVLDCLLGLSDCDEAGCVDLSSDELNCGSCGNACSGGMQCLDSTCRCPGGTVDCGGTCIDPLTDEEHCGVDAACHGGQACTAWTFCVDGQCRSSQP